MRASFDQRCLCARIARVASACAPCCLRMHTKSFSALRADSPPVRISDSISVRASARSFSVSCACFARAYVALVPVPGRGKPPPLGVRRGGARETAGEGCRRAVESDARVRPRVARVRPSGPFRPSGPSCPSGPFRPRCARCLARRPAPREDPLSDPLSVPPRVGRWGCGCAPFDTPGMNGEAPSDMTCGVVARGIGFDTPGMNGEAPSTGSAR